MSAFSSNADMLLASGRDAMSNLYDVYVFPPDNLGAETALASTAVLTTRINDFQPPELYNETYQNHYKADHIDVPTPKLAGEKTFEIPYRIDAAYALHNMFRKWKYASTMNPTSTHVDGIGPYSYNGIWGYRGQEVFGRVAVIAHKYSDLLQDKITKEALDSEIYGIGAGLLAASGNTAAGINYVGWIFDNCWVQRLSEPEYTRESSSKLDATATFYFQTMGLIGPNSSMLGSLGL